MSGSATFVPTPSREAVVGSQQGHPCGSICTVTMGKPVVDGFPTSPHSIQIPHPSHQGLSIYEAILSEHPQQSTVLTRCGLPGSPRGLAWHQISSGSMPLGDAVDGSTSQIHKTSKRTLPNNPNWRLQCQNSPTRRRKYTKRKQKRENHGRIHWKHWPHPNLNKTPTWTLDKRKQTWPKWKISDRLHTDHTLNNWPDKKPQYRRRRNPENAREERIRPQYNNLRSHRKNSKKIPKENGYGEQTMKTPGITSTKP